MLVGAVTASHSLFDSLMNDNSREMKEVTGQMTSGILPAIAGIRLFHLMREPTGVRFLSCADVVFSYERM